MSREQTAEQEINGVNTSALKKTIDEVQKNPEMAKCEFRVHNEWINGDENKSEAYKFYAACDEQMHKKTFEFHAGEPELLAGHDKGANPVEFLLSSLSACMTTTITYYAALDGYKIKSMDSDFKGELDLQGLFNLDPKIRPGFQKIYAKFKVETDAPVSKLQEYYHFSPVYDVISKSVPIDVSIETR
jgi:uncharacterized OsmC-like protein